MYSRFLTFCAIVKYLKNVFHGFNAVSNFIVSFVYDQRIKYIYMFGYARILGHEIGA